MKIKDFLKKLFFKNRNVIHAIIRPEDIVDIPSRAEVKNSRRIAQYKEDYNRNLSENRTLVMKDMHNDNLTDSMQMLIDLLTAIGYIDSDINEVSEVVYPHFIPKLKKNTLKLQMYLLEIEDLIDEVKARLVALYEILEEIDDCLPKGSINLLSNIKKNYFLINKIATIKSEINILSSQLIAFLNQYNGAILIINSYKYNLNTIFSKMSGSKQEDAAYIEEYLINSWWYELEHDLRSVLNNRLDQFLIYYKGDLEKVVAGECFLEKYVYLHKEEILKYEKEIDRLYQDFDISNKEDVLRRIKEIEKRFLLFRRYSRNLVTDEMLDKLWRLKFEVKTFDLEHLPKIAKGNTIEEEYKCYCRILTEKIEKIYFDYHKTLETEFGCKNVPMAVNLIKSFLENFEHKLDFDILFSKDKFTFIMYLDRGLGVDEYLMHGKYINPINFSSLQSYYPINERQNLKVTFTRNKEGTEKISMKTLYTLSEYAESTNMYPCKGNPLFELYYLIEKKKNESYQMDYYLPEGIETITVYDTDSKILNNIRERCCHKTIYMPKTLKSIKGPVFKDVSLTGVVLNEGLEEIENHALDNPRLAYFTIPSSIKYIDNTSLAYREVLSVTFTDYKNSELLKRENDGFNKVQLSFIKNFLKGHLVRVVLIDDDDYIEISATDLARISLKYEKSIDRMFHRKKRNDSLKGLHAIAKELYDLVSEKEIEQEEKPKRISLK